MKSRERVFKAINHERADRVPVDGWFNPIFWKKMKKYCRIAEDEKMLKQLGIDFRTIVMEPGPEFREKAKPFPLHAIGLDEASYITKHVEENIYEDEWGVQIKISGNDWSYNYHPLRGENDFKKLKIPDLEAPGRFDKAMERTEKYKDEYIILAGVSTLFRQGWILRGFQDFLEDSILNTKYIEKLLDKLLPYFIEQTKKYVEMGVDIIQLLGDLGSQTSLFLNPRLWRDLFKPRLSQLINETQKKSIKFFIHSDGNIKDIIPDLIEIGIELINPIQPECMDPVEIKKKYGGRITLYGTLSLQETLTHGSVQDVKDEVKKRIELCGQDGGLILSPANVVGIDTPVENVLALYDTVRELSY